MKRVFVSIELPENLRMEILKIQKEVDRLGLVKGKFTELENLHLTLKFLGELSDTEVRAVKELLKGIKFEPFELEFGGLGVFSEKFIRIIWLGVKSKEIFDLQRRVDIVLEKIFPREYQFMGHVTIARPKKVEQRKMFLEELNKIEVPKLKLKIDRIHLRESKLSHDGAHYKNILEIPSISEKQIMSI